MLSNLTIPASGFPFCRSIDRESTIAKLQICANYSKIPTRRWSESSSPGSRAWRNHGWHLWRRGSRMDVIHEEGDFECNTGMDGKPVQLFQRTCDYGLWDWDLLLDEQQRVGLSITEDKGYSVDGGRPEAQSCSSRVGRWRGLEQDTMLSVLIIIQTKRS